MLNAGRKTARSCGSHAGVLQQLQGHEAVVGAGFRVLKGIERHLKMNKNELK